jgi:hypothetical protein
MANLVVQLRSLKDAHWAEWVERERQRIEIGDAYGIGRFLAAFGGMGSLNDVNVDGRTRETISRCYNLAREIQRELDRPAVSA